MGLGPDGQQLWELYVARAAMGGSDIQKVNAFEEAEAYPGTSLIIAFSQCVAHGCDLMHGNVLRRDEPTAGVDEPGQEQLNLMSSCTCCKSTGV
jgi:hypothetical protein